MGLFSLFALCNVLSNQQHCIPCCLIFLHVCLSNFLVFWETSLLFFFEQLISWFRHFVSGMGTWWVYTCKCVSVLCLVALPVCHCKSVTRCILPCVNWIQLLMWVFLITPQKQVATVMCIVMRQRKNLPQLMWFSKVLRSWYK